MIATPNMSLDTDTQLKEAASRRGLRSGQLQRWASQAPDITLSRGRIYQWRSYQLSNRNEHEGS